MTIFAELAGFLAGRPPAVPLSEVTRVVESQFGLRGQYSPLVSERDQNFSLLSDDGRKYVVKVCNPRETAWVTGRQVALLRHLEKCSPVSTPIVICTSSGQCSAGFDYDSQAYSLRVVSYLDGVPLASLTLSANIAADLGARLAQLDQALESFPVTGDNGFSPWDLQRAAALRDLQQYIDEPAVGSLVERVLDRFDAFVAPRLQQLPKQAIHGDANPENVLADIASRRVTGFIDFGDSVFAPRIADVAIAASYLRATGPRPLRFIEPFVAAYQSRRQLEPGELELLHDLVRTRLATTITMMYWRLSARGDDDPYRQKTLQSERSAIDFLRAIEGI
ncbi:MAG: phosphotransferase [Gammaproteobacteria bacterium]|nr:phosphotransferase [Gammaproteobacteria bacterium]